jgi:hypothetical protein
MVFIPGVYRCIFGKRKKSTVELLGIALMSGVWVSSVLNGVNVLKIM